MLTDEVWAQLDHGAARLPHRQERRIYLTLIALVVAAQMGVFVWVSGVIVPRISLETGSWSGWQVAYYTGFSYVVGIRNDGWLPVTVTGWGASQPGLERQIGPAESPGFTMRPGDVREIEVSYRITDCDAVTNDPAPLAIRVERFWGTHTVYLPLRREHPPGFQGWWSGEPPLEAHLYFTYQACQRSG